MSDHDYPDYDWGLGYATWSNEDRGFITKFSGEKRRYDSGMTREEKGDRPRFALLVPTNVPYEHTMVYRDAMLLARGAENHGARNAELAKTQEELEDFVESAARHFFAWVNGKKDEDHAAAVRWNVRQYEETKWRMGHEDD